LTRSHQAKFAWQKGSQQPNCHNLFLCFFFVLRESLTLIFFCHILPDISSLFLPPPNNKTPIFISFLSNFSHFVPLQLHKPRLFPAPQLSKYWKQKASEEAWGWQAQFSECFQLTVERKIATAMTTTRFFFLFFFLYVLLHFWSILNVFFPFYLYLCLPIVFLNEYNFSQW
jgi:hypothetical protein